MQCKTQQTNSHAPTTTAVNGIGDFLVKADAIAQQTATLIRHLDDQDEAFRNGDDSFYDCPFDRDAAAAAGDIVTAACELADFLQSPPEGVEEVCHTLQELVSAALGFCDKICDNETEQSRIFFPLLVKTHSNLYDALYRAKRRHLSFIGPSTTTPEMMEQYHKNHEQSINERRRNIARKLERKADELQDEAVFTRIDQEAEAKRKEAEQAAMEARLAAAIFALLPKTDPPTDATPEQKAKRKDTHARITGYIAEVVKDTDIDKIAAILENKSEVKDKLLALEHFPLFADILSDSVPDRVVARLLGCSHTRIGEVKKELKLAIAKAAANDADATDDTESKNDEKYDVNPDDDNEAVNADADHLTVIGKDSLRKGQRSSKRSRKLSPTDRAAELADAKHEREAKEWLAKHGGE